MQKVKVELFSYTNKKYRESKLKPINYNEALKTLYGKINKILLTLYNLGATKWSYSSYFGLKHARDNNK